MNRLLTTTFKFIGIGSLAIGSGLYLKVIHLPHFAKDQLVTGSQQTLRY